MDLGAYEQIDELREIVKANGIEVPRLRGYRAMWNESPISEDEIDKGAKSIYDSTFNLYHHKQGDLGGCVKEANRKGKLRFYDTRQAKGRARRATKRYRKQMSVFNRYVGREDVMMIHTRVGGYNWHCGDYGAFWIAKKPWFIEKADDGFDMTYCDIYVKVDRNKTIGQEKDKNGQI